jgi:2-C-methyl-D-erythritol 2,4-cyclodiphosphate synthase
MKAGSMRIGHGYDAHRFDEGSVARPLILGAVTIPYERSLLAHSDGDLVVHALCDALLGAIGAGDIGQHFPDNDARYRGIDSTILLKQVMDMLVRDGWQVVNADMTIVAQAPKLAPYIPAMRTALAALLGTATHQVNIKATTTEGMGFVGRKEGIASYAVVLLGPATA